MFENDMSCAIFQLIKPDFLDSAMNPSTLKYENTIVHYCAKFQLFQQKQLQYEQQWTFKPSSNMLPGYGIFYVGGRFYIRYLFW